MKRRSLLLLLALVASCEAKESITAVGTIQDVKAKYEAQLMAEEGVVSVGIGQDDERQPIIIIGVDSEERLGSGKLPANLDGYPVRVQFIGPIKAR